MVNVYAKAAIIVVLVFIANFYIVRSIDEGRQMEINEKLSALEKNTQSSRVLILYMETLDSDDKTLLCPALTSQINDQINRANELVAQLDLYRQANLLANFEDVRDRYIINNAELWLYLKQEKELCGKQKVFPILYFYPEKSACPECTAQADILDSFKKKCANVRIFAFPQNRKLGIIEVLATKYNITKTPSLVINDKTLEGIIGESVLMQEVPCQV